MQREAYCVITNAYIIWHLWIFIRWSLTQWIYYQSCIRSGCYNLDQVWFILPALVLLPSTVHAAGILPAVWTVEGNNSNETLWIKLDLVASNSYSLVYDSEEVKGKSSVTPTRGYEVLRERIVLNNTCCSLSNNKLILQAWITAFSLIWSQNKYSRAENSVIKNTIN